MSAAIGRRSPPDCSVLTVPVRETGGAQSCIPFLAGLTQSTCALIAVRQAIQNRDDLLSVTFDDIAGDRARIVVECIGVELMNQLVYEENLVSRCAATGPPPHEHLENFYRGCALDSREQSFPVVGMLILTPDDSPTASGTLQHLVDTATPLNHAPADLALHIAVTGSRHFNNVFAAGKECITHVVYQVFVDNSASVRLIHATNA